MSVLAEDGKLIYVTEENLAEYQKKYARELLPTANVTFKLLMGDEEHTDILIHLLNSIPISPDPVVNVTIENVEAPDIDNAFLKFYILDIRAVTDKGEIIIIEMATSENEITVPKFVQYMTRVFSSQLKKGQSYTELKKTIGILIADCRLGVFKNDEFYWRRVRLNDERTGANFTPLLEAYVVELPKMRHLDENHPLTYWIEFLRDPYSVATREICAQVPEIEEAMKIYEKVKSSPNTMDQIIRMEMAEREYNAHVEHEKQKVREEEQKKAHQGKIESAKRLLIKGLKLSDIADALGLPLSEVQALR